MQSGDIKYKFKNMIKCHAVSYFTEVRMSRILSFRGFFFFKRDFFSIFWIMAYSVQWNEKIKWEQKLKMFDFKEVN